MRLDAPIDKYAQQREADRAAQVARHIEKPGGVAGVLAADSADRDLIERHEREDLSDAAQQLRYDEVARRLTAPSGEYR